MEDLTGKQFGSYQIVAPLGEGGMAAVYKAYQPAMERYVALKVLPRHFAEDPQFTARFQREAKILAQLQHPYILPVFDSGQAEGYSYIVMPFVQSGTLTDMLKGQPLPLPLIRKIITQIGEALNYAHARGLVHRDVKPSNVLMDESGNCLLTDFGLARIVEASVNLTASGSLMGTPAYMSPEQGTGQKVDARSDIYSLGVILYELVTGRVPYKAETPVAVIFKHIQDPLPSARGLNPELPEAIERVILKALSKRPEDRYQTAADMVKAIQAAISDFPSVPAETVTLKREAHPANKPWVYWVLGGVVIMLLGGLFGPGLLNALSTAKGEEPVQTASVIHPSITPTLILTPTSIPTFTPTATPALYEPLLAYIESESPTFEDDFSEANMVWGSTSEGFLMYSFVEGGALTIRDHWAQWEGLKPDYHVPGLSFPTTKLFSATNFALEFDFAFEGSSIIGVQFRSSSARNTGYNINMMSNGAWNLTQNGDAIISSEGDSYIRGPYHTLLLIVHDENLAIFLNDKLLCDANDLDLSGTTNKITVEGNYDKAGGKFDNIKFWNLDGVDEKTSIAATAIPQAAEITTSTPDLCAGATSAGARQKFTFEQIVPCLDTPRKLVEFMSSNINFDGGWDNKTYGDNAYSPAAEVYANGVDDCDGFAEFAACVLSKHGYEAYNVGISVLGPTGHNTTGYIDRDGLKYSISNGQNIAGPFNTWEELAQFYIDGKMAAPPDGVIWLFSPCIDKRAVGRAMLDLPHTVFR